jgi:hypothetical protein
LGGQAATRTWHAYLSQEQRGNTPPINARDRIGTGPWYNVSQLIASNVADLHGDQQRDRNHIQRGTALDVKGNEIPGAGSPRGSTCGHENRRGMSLVGLVSRVTPVQTALRNCTRDEGGPFEFGNQVLISSHRKLLWSKAMVVSVAEKSGHDPTLSEKSSASSAQLVDLAA